jgi:putative aldouronate transport system permease protein
MMILASIVFIYPVFYCLVASLSDPVMFEAHSGPLLLPLGFNVKAYGLIFNDRMILRGLFNSVFYVIAGTAVNLLLTSFAAYVLSRKGYIWKNTIMILVVITMYFSGGLIPYFLTVKELGLFNNPMAMIIPQAINTFNLIIMRTYFLTIPDSMEESARLDGANDFTILFRIMLPLAMPVVAVMIIYYGVGHWNDWFSGMLFLMKKPDWHPLQLILRNLLTRQSAVKMTLDSNQIAAQQMAQLIQYALIILTIAPVISIYPFMQKHFIKGVMIGSVKE